VEHIITHEHIHLLQHTFRTNEKDFGQPIKYIRAPDLVLSEEYCDDGFTIYLLEKNEVEARLHEVILSIYVKYRELPLTVPAFFNALAQNEQLNFFFKGQNWGLPTDEYCERFSESYETRSRYIGEDLFILIAAMRNNKTSIRFVLEVLAPMYVNLLRYYGDEEASFQFGCQIQRPNLYDRLYLNR
jgi:hypothetical protein